MAVHYRTQGIFVKISARGEADEFFAVYTKDFGRLKILGKAIKKITSKLKGGASLFYLSEIEFIQGKSHKTLTDAILIESFRNVRKDLVKLRIAHKIAQVLDELVPKEEKDEQIWQLLSETFHRLDTTPTPPTLRRGVGAPTKSVGAYKAYYYFFWNLVSLLGYHPEISNCSLQGREINCDIVKILKIILKKDWGLLLKIKIEPIHLRLFKNISEWYNNNVVRH